VQQRESRLYAGNLFVRAEIQAAMSENIAIGKRRRSR